ncbi:polysaccharide deacetylase family protein [uncultured Demequina sp.]|uniref:polysaccharide deacetylase family protein n=1 Tax=uncultured Demequina sp. TaxID=693499 RepID=UPI0025ED6B58|nr:polysaccharide deacetylase family protein [uncultured Demequina sp.]
MASGRPGDPIEQVTAAAGAGDVCALTFDDGPAGDDTEALLDGLAERGIRAVFCVVGGQIQRPGGNDLLRRMVADGHVLANHSTGFDDMGDWGAERVRADLAENLRIIRDAAGAEVPVPYWRAPNGSWGVTEQVALDLGMRPLGVVNHIGDWEVQDAEVLAERLRTVMTPGSMVLAHDGPSDRAATVKAVLRVVDERLALGWRFTLPAP